mmetsp:Transcript_95884/g.276250  ORF Transcript_95884/g.276250 Transcript_95884/m.276250 type:complete len:233 (+) Transcript_95884:2055-2753(+)
MHVIGLLPCYRAQKGRRGLVRGRMAAQQGRRAVPGERAVEPRCDVGFGHGFHGQRHHGRRDVFVEVGAVQGRFRQLRLRHFRHRAVHHDRREDARDRAGQLRDSVRHGLHRGGPRRLRGRCAAAHAVHRRRRPGPRQRARPGLSGGPAGRDRRGAGAEVGQAAGWRRRRRRRRRHGPTLRLTLDDGLRLSMEEGLRLRARARRLRMRHALRARTRGPSAAVPGGLSQEHASC